MELTFDGIQENITKDFILSKINQESIMEYYTGVSASSKKLALSPFRADNKVTCSCYKSKSGILYLHDFATNEHINCFEAVMRLNNCNYFQALEIIAEDFGLIDNKKFLRTSKPKIVPEIKQTEICNIRVQTKEFTEEELKWWKSFGIDKKLLKKYHVYSLQHVFIDNRLSFSSNYNNPIFGYYFGKDKNSFEFWKIYFPRNKEKGIRFLNNLSNKKLQGYKQLNKSGDLLIITKSLKDCIAFRAFGFDAVAPSSESTFCNDERLSEFKQRFKHILVIYDQDKAGKYNMAKIRHKYPELNYFVIPKEYNSKDFSDLIQNHGLEKVKELIDKFISNYKFK